MTEDEDRFVHDREQMTRSLSVVRPLIGKGSEAATGNLFVKFGVVRPYQDAPAVFARLIDACEAVAADAECQGIIAGVNTARHQAYRQMINRGFRTFLEGVAMLRPNEPGYNRGDCFLIDDLR